MTTHVGIHGWSSGPWAVHMVDGSPHLVVRGEPHVWELYPGHFVSLACSDPWYAGGVAVGPGYLADDSCPITLTD